MTPHREIRCPPTGTSPVRGQGDELSAHKEIPLSVDTRPDGRHGPTLRRCLGLQPIRKRGGPRGHASIMTRDAHGMMSGMSLPTPTLQTARMRLRPFTDTDADALFALHSNAHVLRYWDSAPWTEPARAQLFLATCRQMEEQGSGARLAMERSSDGTFLGWCGLSRWNPEYRSASLGYCLEESAWGQGYATEATGALLQWAFDTLDLNRVQAETDTRNLASMRVLEKLGFVPEGTLREDCVVNGEVSDSHVFGLLRREWRALLLG